ncbi:MAG: hypothetical protein HC921_19050 [Synechococcaceae cyanobacterium SM2_3_1]|nr:hypothetical protein [Synechococcaceae cyanobacterium SM2_3_1]
MLIQQNMKQVVWPTIVLGIFSSLVAACGSSTSTVSSVDPVSEATSLDSDTESTTLQIANTRPVILTPLRVRREGIIRFEGSGFTNVNFVSVSGNELDRENACIPQSSGNTNAGEFCVASDNVLFVGIPAGTPAGLIRVSTAFGSSAFRLYSPRTQQPPTPTPPPEPEIFLSRIMVVQSVRLHLPSL